MTNSTDVTFKSLGEVQSCLDRLGLFRMDLSLERMRRALVLLEMKRPPFVVVQILGTNGKGSTATFLAALCQAHGCRCGLYTSPHFVSPLERILVDGMPLSETQWVRAANVLSNRVRELTYFEWLTTLAALLFRENNVDVAILEAGLGGRYDATTALEADLLCYTPIAMDHRDVLGQTLRQIATDKAAAIRSDAPVVTAGQYPQAADCLAVAARKHNAPLHQARALTKNALLQPNLAGPHQLLNAGTALGAWLFLAPMLRREVDNIELQCRGLRRAFLPGRLQRLAACAEYPDMLLDGAHNPHGMKALLDALRDTDIRPSCAVFSCLADKDWRPSVVLLRHFLGNTPVFVPASQNPRAASAAVVASVYNSVTPQTAKPVADLSEALSVAGGSKSGTACPVLLTGSLYLLAEFFILYPASQNTRCHQSWPVFSGREHPDSKDTEIWGKNLPISPDAPGKNSIPQLCGKRLKFWQNVILNF